MDGLYLADKMKKQLEETKAFYEEQIKVFNEKISEIDSILKTDEVVEEENLEIEEEQSAPAIEPEVKPTTIDPNLTAPISAVAPTFNNETEAQDVQPTVVEPEKPKFESLWWTKQAESKGIVGIKNAFEPYPEVEIVNPNNSEAVKKEEIKKETSVPKFNDYNNIEIDIVNPKAQSPVAAQPAPAQAISAPQFDSYSADDIQIVNPNAGQVVNNQVGVSQQASVAAQPKPTYVEQGSQPKVITTTLRPTK